MLLIPSIDILEGRCVRLYQGDYDRSTKYSDDPVAIARNFETSGAVRIHIVDLDAARGKGNHNRATIDKIREGVECIVEVGGGVRKSKDIEELLKLGVDRLVVGTVLAKDQLLVQSWVSEFGPVFIAGIDARGGEVKVSGWERGSGMADTELASRAKSIGVRSIVYTSIARDGTLEGPDIPATCRIANVSDLPVILSGGVSTIEDLTSVNEADCTGIVAVISGKAIYEGNLDPAEVFEKYPPADYDFSSW